MDVRRRVLFVDDEPIALQALENRLHQQRQSWEMVFAEGPEAALAALQQGHFDVVASDLRMPQMDGAELLTRVRDLYPGTARIILSGPETGELAARALPVAHQFLDKSCEVEALRSVVDRACHLLGLLQSARLRELVGRLQLLPSPPGTYLELGRVLAAESTGVAEVVAVVQRDPALTTKILQLVNSAYFGLRQQTSSVERAVAYLGMECVRSLALGAHLFSSFESPPIRGFSLEALQSMAVWTARTVQTLVSPGARDTGFTAGLVHSAGRMVLAACLPGELERTIDLARKGSSLVEAEREVFGASYAEVGACLLGMWGVPFDVVEAVGLHPRLTELQPGGAELVCALHAVVARMPGSPLPALDRLQVARAVGTARLAQWEKMLAAAAPVVAPSTPG